MTQFLISLDEFERVKKTNRIESLVALADRTGLSRSTWTRVVRTRKPTNEVLQALAELGANPARILIADETSRAATTAA